MACKTTKSNAKIRQSPEKHIKTWWLSLFPLRPASTGLQDEQAVCHHLNLSHWNKSKLEKKKRSHTRELRFSYKEDTRMVRAQFPVCIPLGLAKHFNENIIVSWLKEHSAKPFWSEHMLIQLDQHIHLTTASASRGVTHLFPSGNNTFAYNE